MTPEASPDATVAGSGVQEGRNAAAIVSSLWEKLESLVQLELKLALAEADDKVSTLKRDVFTEAEAKVSALKVDVFAEADARISALKRELTAKAIGGSIAFASILALVGALVALLALVMEVWIAALITSSVLAVASFALLRRSLTVSPDAADEPSTRASLAPAPTTKETSHGTT